MATSPDDEFTENWTVAALAAMTIVAFYAARAGQPLFGKALTTDGNRKYDCVNAP